MTNPAVWQKFPQQRPSAADRRDFLIIRDNPRFIKKALGLRIPKLVMELAYWNGCQFFIDGWEYVEPRYYMAIPPTPED